MVEGEVALGTVGNGVVCVKRVVPVSERGEVVVYAIDHGIRGIAAFWEFSDAARQELWKIEERHNGRRKPRGRGSSSEVGSEEVRWELGRMCRKSLTTPRKRH